MKERLLFTNDYSYYAKGCDEWCKENEVEFNDNERYEWINSEIELDFDDFITNIESLPTANTFYGYGYVVYGEYSRWNGTHSGHFNKIYETLAEAVKVCIPNYDAHIKFYVAENGDLCYTESSHDSPTGGTKYIIRKLSTRGADYMLNHQYDYYEDLISKAIACIGMTKRIGCEIEF